MGYYPIFVELRERRCAVIGGGVVAERKVKSLVKVGANVTVISPAVTERLASWAEKKKIRYIARKYRQGDLRRFDIAFVATCDSRANAAVLQEGRKRHVWVNVVDDPGHCDFISPSVLRRGELVVAVATGGASPALARAIRRELEDYFSEDYTVLAHIASEVRRELRTRSRNGSAKAWQQALNGELHQLITQGKEEEAKAYLLKRLETGR